MWAPFFENWVTPYNDLQYRLSRSFSSQNHHKNFNFEHKVVQRKWHIFFQHFCTKTKHQESYRVYVPTIFSAWTPLKFVGCRVSQGSPANCLKWGSEAYLLLSLDVDGTLVLPALTRVAKKLLFFLDSLILKHDLKEFHYRISIKFSLYNMTHTRTVHTIYAGWDTTC